MGEDQGTMASGRRIVGLSLIAGSLGPNRITVDQTPAGGVPSPPHWLRGQVAPSGLPTVNGRPAAGYAAVAAPRTNPRLHLGQLGGAAEQRLTGWAELDRPIVTGG